VKERDFLNWIIACAEATGWKVWHVPAPMTATGRGAERRFVGAKRAAGLPDLFLLHDDPPRMIVAEVKGAGGKLSEKQREFLQMARTIADVTTVWGHIATFDGPTEVARENDRRYIGVYAWTPADQPIIETMLKSKVLL
jgi:hypothetical protein